LWRSDKLLAPAGIQPLFLVTIPGYTHLNESDILLVGLQNIHYDQFNKISNVVFKLHAADMDQNYEGWNFNSGNYLFTTDTK